MKLETNIAGVPVVVSYDELPEASRSFVIEYGLRQYIQDGAAVSKVHTSGDNKGTAKTEAEILAEKQDGVIERLENLRTGEFTRRGTAVRQSPEEAERDRICEQAIRDAAKAANVKLPTKKADADWWKAKTAAYYEKYRTNVDKEVARRMKASAPVDMTGILD